MSKITIIVAKDFLPDNTNPFAMTGRRIKYKNCPNMNGALRLPTTPLLLQL
jgi:hypothetical protein